MRNGSRRLAFSIIVWVVLVLGACVTLFPIYMGILNSLKTEGDMMNNILSIPAQFEFGNYKDAFEKTNYLRSLGNTALVSVAGLVGIIVFSSMAGYKLSRTPGKLSTFLFNLFVLSMLIPFHSIMISLNRVSMALQVQGTLVGLSMIYVGLGVSMAIFLYHGFVKSIPRDIDEAAVIDGCGELRLYVTVILPLLMPITMTAAILNLLWMWNDFLLPLLMLSDSDQYTLLLSINMLFGQYGNNDWAAILPALVLTMLPVIVVYLLLQKYILNGVGDGAVKG
ncbi:carbohydrate ABC transporter permease [Paenibacillus sp. YIM B09110]|uniref:carbohydrate ABC transporter permease n=1 Tax=Paenibacillus sp. YIM B09110 TaxID=3126102 RepID=UPI00301E0169